MRRDINEIKESYNFIINGVKKYNDLVNYLYGISRGKYILDEPIHYKNIEFIFRTTSDNYDRHRYDYAKYYNSTTLDEFKNNYGEFEKCEPITDLEVLLNTSISTMKKGFATIHQLFSELEKEELIKIVIEYQNAKPTGHEPDNNVLLEYGNNMNNIKDNFVKNFDANYEKIKKTFDEKNKIINNTMKRLNQIYNKIILNIETCLYKSYQSKDSEDVEQQIARSMFY